MEEKTESTFCSLPSPIALMKLLDISLTQSLFIFSEATFIFAVYQHPSWPLSQQVFGLSLSSVPSVFPIPLSWKRGRACWCDLLLCCGRFCCQTWVSVYCTCACVASSLILSLVSKVTGAFFLDTSVFLYFQLSVSLVVKHCCSLWLLFFGGRGGALLHFLRHPTFFLPLWISFAGSFR